MILAERMLTAELSHHLASEDQAGRNHRNGSSPKKVLTPSGELQLDVPRDRQSSFEPKLGASTSASKTMSLACIRRRRARSASCI
jgi:transposase-like protein